ncbi:uncharacterized protein [Diabrotica undecimpunctata]|uniref:uncharacterized protein n=1 Tax=Diabrotica undecimpunctata TaxID=50387 RepID=UPI003B634BE0
MCYLYHAVIICLIAIGCFDVLLGTLVIMVVVQWKMLNREVKRVIDSTADTDEERCQLKNDIKNCVNHHNFLIDYVQRLNETVWYSNSIVILLAAVTYCVEIFVIVKRQNRQKILRFPAIGMNIPLI